MEKSCDVSLSDARQRLAALVDQVRAEHEPVYLSHSGKRLAAIIAADDLDRILELAEDMADIRAAEQARAEMQSTGQQPIPWDEVEAELGPR